MAMKGKICVVTGAGSGIGQATAVVLARQEAASIALCDVDEKGLEETKNLCAASSDR